MLRQTRYDWHLVWNPEGSGAPPAGCRSECAARPDVPYNCTGFFGCACTCELTQNTTRPHLQGVLGWTHMTGYNPATGKYEDLGPSWDADN